jgi:hypothetical protein
MFDHIYNLAYLENKSEFVIARYHPDSGINGIIYPDTVLKIDKRIGCCLQPGEIVPFLSTSFNYESWIASFKNDTISFYIFNQDTVDMYEWEKICKDYKILKRYDLSKDDLMHLKKIERGDLPVITYPPDERMKNMKMYPPYGE